MLNMDQNLPLLWKRGIKRGLRTAQRGHRWMASLGALFGTLLILQLLIFGLAGAQTVQSLLQSRTDLRLEIRQNASDQQRQEFFGQLNQLSYIDETVYITKEQAYEYARTHDPDLIAFLEKYGMENPFSDTIGITLISLGDYDSLTEFLQQEKWKGVVDPTFLSEVTNQEAQVRALLRLTIAGRALAIMVLTITGCVLLLMIMELVRRRSLDRADEVFVEQLVGASPLSIFLPFAVEATLMLWIAIIASGFALVMLLLALPALLPTMQGTDILEAFGTALTSRARSFLPIAFTAEILLAPMIAALGAWFGIWPQIRSHTLPIRKV